MAKTEAERWCIKVMKEIGVGSTERRITTQKNLENENMMCQPQKIWKMLRKKKKKKKKSQ